jgi:hypothetical protein
MRHWFSRDSIKAKIGAAGVVLLAITAVAASTHHGVQHSADVEQNTATIKTAPQSVATISEKPKASITETKIETTEEAVPFSTTQTYDGTLAKDTQVVRVEGANGKKVVKTEVKLKDGVEVSRELISEDITVPPVTQVVAIGTKVVPKASKTTDNSCDPHYTPCVKKSAHDIDCRDLGYRVRVVTIGQDPYGLDWDDNGVGCENYPDLPQQQ